MSGMHATQEATIHAHPSKGGKQDREQGTRSLQQLALSIRLGRVERLWSRSEYGVDPNKCLGQQEVYPSKEQLGACTALLKQHTSQA